VTGQRRLHRDLGGFEVADFAHHHHVRILAQDGAQAAGEGHVHLGVDLGLADAVDVVLDRVLDRHDVARVVVDLGERRIEVVDLPEPVGPVTSMMPWGLRMSSLMMLRLASVHAELLELEAPVVLVEQTQHHPLAVAGRHGGDAHVHGAAAMRNEMRPSCGTRFSAMSSGT
jgi:hypothetical protein